MAAKAVAFTEALKPEFSAYAHRIVENSKALAASLTKAGFHVISGGSDNHLVVTDVAKSFGITGRQAEDAVRQCGITLNRNPIPFDVNGPWYTSGLRLGTAAVTTLGMGPDQMAEIADVMGLILTNTKPTTSKSGAPDKSKYKLDPTIRTQALDRIQNLLKSYPVYPEIDLDLLRESVGMGNA
jgi:glycine hydroxymethyltransferase